MIRIFSGWPTLRSLKGGIPPRIAEKRSRVTTEIADDTGRNFNKLALNLTQQDVTEQDAT